MQALVFFSPLASLVKSKRPGPLGPSASQSVFLFRGLSVTVSAPFQFPPQVLLNENMTRRRLLASHSLLFRVTVFELIL